MQCARRARRKKRREQRSTRADNTSTHTHTHARTADVSGRRSGRGDLLLVPRRSAPLFLCFTDLSSCCVCAHTVVQCALSVAGVGRHDGGTQTGRGAEADAQTRRHTAGRSECYAIRVTRDCHCAMCCRRAARGLRWQRDTESRRAAQWRRRPSTAPRSLSVCPLARPPSLFPLVPSPLPFFLGPLHPFLSLSVSRCAAASAHLLDVRCSLSMGGLSAVCAALSGCLVFLFSLLALCGERERVRGQGGRTSAVECSQVQRSAVKCNGVTSVR